MLTEFQLKQDEPSSIKRWFQDDYFDLFIWQNTRVVKLSVFNSVMIA